MNTLLLISVGVLSLACAAYLWFSIMFPEKF